MHKASQGPKLQMNIKGREAHRRYGADAGGKVEAMQVELSSVQPTMMQLCKVQHHSHMQRGRGTLRWQGAEAGEDLEAMQVDLSSIQMGRMQLGQV